MALGPDGLVVHQAQPGVRVVRPVYPVAVPLARAYARQVVANARALAAALAERGFHVVSGGTDNHLMLVDLRNRELTGKVAEQSLDRAGITHIVVDLEQAVGALDHLHRATDGRSLEVNVAVALANATVAGAIATAWSRRR